MDREDKLNTKLLDDDFVSKGAFLYYYPYYYALNRWQGAQLPIYN